MTVPFRLAKSPTLSRSTVDRQETLRADPERLRARWATAQVVLLDDKARTPVREGEKSLATRKPGDTSRMPRRKWIVFAT